MGKGFEKKKGFQIIYNVVLSSIFALSVFLLVLFLVFLFFNYRGESTKNEKGVNRYKYLEMTLSNNEVKKGFVEIFYRFEKGYRFTEDNGKLVLISEISSKMYKGEGSCDCGKRKKISSVKYLFSAKNSQDSNTNSKNELKEICRKKLSCEVTDISVQVNHLDELNDPREPKESDFEILEDEDDYEEEEEEPGEMVPFYCHGECVVDLTDVDEDQIDIIQKLENNMDCSKLRRSGDSVVEKYLVEEYPPSDLYPIGYLSLAEDDFVHKYLRGWCEENSRLSERISYVNSEEENIEIDHSCYGARFDNPTVKCAHA